jgi:uncharacterized membrane protein YhaH (DUF805 family)
MIGLAFVADSVTKTAQALTDLLVHPQTTSRPQLPQIPSPMEQSTSNAAAAGIGLFMILMLLAVSIAVYIFACFCLKRICEKCGHQPGVLVWIPIVQLVPLLQVAGMATWMLILFFIPFVNLIVGIIMWAKICSARGKSPWLVLLMFIPLANIFFLLYLAFSE